jgi:hypothetical protein
VNRFLSLRNLLVALVMMIGATAAGTFTFAQHAADYADLPVRVERQAAALDTVRALANRHTAQFDTVRIWLRYSACVLSAPEEGVNPAVCADWLPDDRSLLPPPVRRRGGPLPGP